MTAGLRRVALPGLVVLAAFACSGGETATPTVGADAVPAGFVLTSGAFPEGGPIPVEYSCDGENVPPPLQWTGVPTEAAALQLVLGDPDAPGGEFIHWVVVDLPGGDGGLDGTVPPEAVEATNDTGTPGYVGPCPPPGDPHHYTFELTATSAPLGLTPTATAAEVRAAAAATSVGAATLVGTYPPP